MAVNDDLPERRIIFANRVFFDGILCLQPLKINYQRFRETEHVKY
jgi:hypothetical protein